MTVKPPAPPALPDELEQLLRRMRLPYIRRAAPEVIANATAQRWEHAEVLRVLLAEEVCALCCRTRLDRPPDRRGGDGCWADNRGRSGRSPDVSRRTRGRRTR